jgi:hypothetical protein
MPRSPWTWVAGLATAAGLTRVPFAGRNLSPDEGGLLILAGQWSPGASLYGDYFVDRPPILIALFALADQLGGSPWALRSLGIIAVVATVLLAGVVGRVAAPYHLAPILTATTAAILAATPLFGATMVNGELLGLPFLVGGSAAAILAMRATSTRPGLLWGLLAGAAGATGALVKQSLVDVFVLAVVLALVQRRARPLLAIAAGAVVVVAATTWIAHLRGTDPGDLWDAVVVFRQQAAAVIADSATSSTGTRLRGMLVALLASGAPVLAVVLARTLRRPAGHTPDLRWPAAAVLAWELAVVLGGGSYWLHYLMGLVPGMVLLAAAAAQRPMTHRRLLQIAYGVSAASTVVALVWIAVHPVDRPEDPAIAYLDEHAERGDTAVVAFGAPNILQATGLVSPYPDLWSLPVRVHDPELADLTALLDGPDRPTWLIVAGTSLGTWGVAATTADHALAEHYALVTSAGYWTIYRESETP